MKNVKMFATRIDPDIYKKLKHLSIDADISLAAVVEEALLDLLRKYSGPPTPTKKKKQ